MTLPPFHPEAEVEMFEALGWYEALDLVEGTLLASDLQHRLITALEDIQRSPAHFPPYLFGTRRCLLNRFPYSIRSEAK